ncbi:MYDGF isoform 1, partial [Pongo abelii]
HQHFTCTIWRPQGKSYLYFTQFKAEVQGAEIEYAMAYSKAAFERESDVPLKTEEFEVTKTAVISALQEKGDDQPHWTDGETEA